ncbi:hypothetical protein HHK36_019430 [Tetracentron sinense]|uniref:Uncharacterized protein n=1 Tax=Tetracentron sinense TaxID=13715 RepID=A0A834YTU4_TETSI|nr:hypothetical protein HHK36_019430 [Tetracentron sinense]
MATEAGSYEGGAGGKFRKRPFRRSATPYDRPPTALRNPSEPGRNGWLSKLVDPASRIITKSAQMFFPSVFRKNLPALQTVSDTNQESRNELMETVPINTSGAEERVSNEGDNPSDNFNSNGAEIDHLTELLRSRTVDVPVEHENKSSEPSTPQPVAAHDRQVELVDNPVLENGINRQRLVGVISTPEVLEEDVDSPARLAKDYMGSRPLKASPSILGFRSQAFRDTAALQSNLSFPPMSPSMSLAPRSAIRFAGVTGVPEVGGLTPRPRGRSAIYSMARTPFSKVHLSAANKGVGSTIDRYAGPSTSSQLTWENNSLSSGQQISKRRSSVLDSDIGSVGTIRRIRQKTNLISPLKHIRSVHGSPLSLPGIGVGSDAAQRSRSSFQKPLLLDQPKYNSSNMLVENEDNSIPSTSFAAVPTQSSEMARKILQQLDKLVPSPKEKSSELKLATAKERSPTKLTVSMSYRQAFRSVEDVESSKFLHNAQVNGNLDGLGGTHVPGSRDSTSQKQDKVEENGPSKIAVPRDRLAHVVNGVDTTISINDLAPGVNAADLSISYFNANPPQKKRAFQMSAQELSRAAVFNVLTIILKDALEQDDGGYSTGVASTATATGRENTSVAESKTIAAESVTVDKPPSSFSEIKSPANFVWNKGTSTGASDGTVVAQKNMAFTFTVAPSPSSSTQPATFAPESTSVFDEAVPPKEPTTASVFSFSSKSVDKAPPITFSSTYSGLGEFSGLKSGVLSDSKLETSSSFATVAATATNTISKTAEADKSDNDYSRKPGDLFPKPATAISSGVSISTSPSSFSFGASTNNSSLNNGLLAANPSIFSILAPSVPVSGSSTNQFFSSGSTFIATNATPSSSPSTSATAPTFPSAPMFQFGSNTSSSSLSNAVSPASATSGIEARDFEPKTKQASTFGSQTRSPFSITSASNGSSIFGNTASATTSIMKFSTANNQPQSSTPFVTGTGSLFGAQAAPGGTGVASFTQSMPSQFGSSASSPTYGLSGASAFTSGSSVFGSSTPATKVFDSSSGFGLSSSAAFSTGANSSSGSSTISSVFGSSLQPATSSIFGSSFGSSPSPTTGFSFGGSSTAVTGTGSAPITFGSSIAPPTDSMFSFTSAITTSSSASFSPLQHVFGNPNSVVTYGSASPGNDQMNMEDSMAEDTAQASTPAVSAFGQPAASPPPSNLVFGSPSPSGALPFQFGSQQNLSTPQNPSSFQAAGSLELNAEGSFSLGTGGTDKSNRKFVKVRRDKVRKR